MARIHPGSIARTLNTLSRAGRWVGEWRFGPGARWTHLTVRMGLEPVIDVGSWHELAEHDRDIVATSTGLEPLSGRQRGEVLAGQAPEYQAFLAKWKFVKSAALSLIPDQGTAVEPAVEALLPW
jgi:hypothetical protein